MFKAIPLLWKVIGLVVLFGGAFGAFKAWEHSIYMQGFKAADDACTIRVMDAANRAREAAEAQRQAAGEAALKAFRDAAELRVNEEQKRNDQLELEIADNEQALAANGRSCLADDSDVEWVLRP